jgi:hypothetical protein
MEMPFLKMQLHPLCWRELPITSDLREIYVAKKWGESQPAIVNKERWAPLLSQGMFAIVLLTKLHANDEEIKH